MANYFVIPVRDLEKFRQYPVKQRAIDGAAEEQLNGNEVKVVKVITVKQEKEVNA